MHKFEFHKALLFDTIQPMPPLMNDRRERIAHVQRSTQKFSRLHEKKCTSIYFNQLILEKKIKLIAATSPIKILTTKSSTLKKNK